MSIENEIVKLVREIGKLEKKIEDAKHNEATFKTPTFKSQYAAEAKMLEESLERKMRLLMILKS